ncbi:hypothetical protein Dimus_023570 [Dionaea muscipula]
MLAAAATATSAGEEAAGNGYPAPLATHEEVVSQPGLFWDTLKTFHSILCTKFSVPVIAKKDLDLHMLYVEVTKRGGFDKVVSEKKWREIGSAFNFAPTTTSASFVLKKHYSTLLYHYEQVYFFNSPAPAHHPPASLAHDHYVCGPDMADNGEYTPNGGGGFSDSSPVRGTIDGKFDCGYMVTVRLGSELLHGVLYHPEKRHPVSVSVSVSCSIPDPDKKQLSSTAIVPYDPKEAHRQGGGRRRRRKRKRWGGDPTHPKPNRSGYNFYFAEQHSMLKSLYPDIRERQFTKMIGLSWNNLSPEDRTVYQNIGLRDKERYKRELDEYKERLNWKQRPETSSQAGHRPGQ